MKFKDETSQKERKMEDGVPEAESLLRPTSLREDELGIKERKNPKVAKAEGEDRASGFISHVVSNLVTGGDTDEEKQDKEDDAETVPNPEGEKKEEKGGGVLDHSISNLVSPSSPGTGKNCQGKVEAFDVKSENEAEEEVGCGGGGGGLINNIVSNLFHRSEGAAGESRKEKGKEEMVMFGGKENTEKTEEGGGGGGIIDSIVSHMPASLSHDAAPTTDEATILIHIVQD